MLLYLSLVSAIMSFTCTAETTVLANDLKDKGFTVVSLDPGDVSTVMWQYLMKHVYTDSSGTKSESRH